MSTAPCDMRSGIDSLMNQIIAVFGAAQVHHAYLFANLGANLMKVIVHDGFGVWLCNRRLHKGSFNWGNGAELGASITLSTEQFNALIVGLPWQRLGENTPASRVFENELVTASIGRGDYHPEEFPE